MATKLVCKSPFLASFALYLTSFDRELLFDLTALILCCSLVAGEVTCTNEFFDRMRTESRFVEVLLLLGNRPLD